MSLLTIIADDPQAIPELGLFGKILDRYGLAGCLVFLAGWVVFKYAPRVFDAMVDWLKAEAEEKRALAKAIPSIQAAMDRMALHGEAQLQSNVRIEQKLDAMNAQLGTVSEGVTDLGKSVAGLSVTPRGIG